MYTVHVARKKESTESKERDWAHILIRADDDYVFAFSRSHLTALLVAPKSPAAILFRGEQGKNRKGSGASTSRGRKREKKRKQNISAISSIGSLISTQDPLLLQIVERPVLD